MNKKEYTPANAVPFTDEDFIPDNRPKVLFAAVYAPTFNSDFMIRGFEQAGYNVLTVDWQKLKMMEQVEGLRDRLITKAYMEKPEFIFLHIQNEGVINIDTAIELQKIAPVVSYNFDCRTFDKSKWLYDLAPHISLSVFSNMEDVAQCHRLGIDNVTCMHSSADFNHYRPVKSNESFKANYPHDIVFIGNKFDKTNMKFDKAEERTQMIDFLANEYGDRFRVWGIGYSRMVNQQEEVLIYNSAKIAITQNNFYRTRYCSDRIFRAMGCGVMTIQQYYPEINKDFNSNVTSTWLNFDMLKKEIDKHLEDENLRAKKAAAGAKFVRENHSWYNRVLEIQKHLKIQKDVHTGTAKQD